MSKVVRDILIFVIAISVAIAVFMGYQRHDYEMRNKNVEIVVNLSDVENYATRSGRELPQELTLFKAPGTTTILYKEETVADLKKYISIYNGPDFLLNMDRLIEEKIRKQLLMRNDLNYNYSYIFVQEKSVYERMIKHLAAKMPDTYLSQYEITVADGHPSWLIITGLSGGPLADLGFGFNSNIVSYLEKMDLQVLPQIRTWNNAKPEGVKAIFNDLEGHQNIKTILFNDKVLPGYPDKARLSILAQMIKQRGWNIGLIEFMPQQGFEYIAYANDKKVVRFFSIDSKEGDKITPDIALGKYTLAASERNDKLIYVRPLNFNNVDQEQGYISHIDGVRRGLSTQNLTVGPFKENVSFPISKYPVEIFVIIMGLGVIASGLLLADKLGYLKWGIIAAIAIFFVNLYLTLFTVNDVLAKIALAEKAMALLAAIIFPTLAVISTLSKQDRNIWQSMWAFLKASLISFVGAILVIGFLADKAYIIKIDQFQGVKLAHLAPMAIVVWYLFTRDEAGKSFARKTMDILKQPLTFGYAMISAVLLAAVAIYLARTGNEATALVSGAELKFRALLDQLLYVRPRTKEFLIGHPLLFMSYYLGYRFRYLPLVVFAVIGQVSLVDTFAHIHTPILISLIRTFNGIWLGLALGIAAIVAYLYYVKNWGSEVK